MDDVLLVFAKVPRPGEVKTRLTPTLTSDEAATLYEAFLHDAFDQYSQLSCDVRLYLAPPHPEQQLEGIPEDVTVHGQDGKGLGDRMCHAFRDVFSEGYERAVLIGTDHPTLPTAFVQRSFVELGSPGAICIGPTIDGGFYLLGMSSFYPQLFDEMTYSHTNVFSETITRVGDTDAHCTTLPEWYDVDTPADLDQLLDDLKRTDEGAPRTRKAIEELGVRDRFQTT